MFGVKFHQLLSHVNPLGIRQVSKRPKVSPTELAEWVVLRDTQRGSGRQGYALLGSLVVRSQQKDGDRLGIVDLYLIKA